jgi:hypothetical protein
MLSSGNLSSDHFVRGLRDIDFAANTMIRFSELTWEEILGPNVDHNAARRAMVPVNAAMKAGLQLVDADGESVELFFVRIGGGPGRL